MAIVKTTTYGVMHMTVAIAVAYALSGNWAIALSIGLIEPLVQTFFYHMHEKAWKRVPIANTPNRLRPFTYPIHRA